MLLHYISFKSTPIDDALKNWKETQKVILKNAF